MEEKRKQELIEEFSDHHIEGLDSCLHGNHLYETCRSCGRYIDKEGKIIWDAKGSWDDIPEGMLEKIKDL